MNAIKAVVFDWGGVLIDDPLPSLIDYCRRRLAVTSERFAQALDLFIPDFQKNLSTEAVFWQNICRFLNVPCPAEPSLWGQAFRSVYRPRREIFQSADSLRRQGYKIALLSNTELPSLQFFYQQSYCTFDVTVFSCEHGCRKPEKEIYDLTARKLRLPPHEIFFFDDREEYVTAAINAGWSAARFENSAQIHRLFLIK